MNKPTDLEIYKTVCDMLTAGDNGDIEANFGGFNRMIILSFLTFHNYEWNQNIHYYLKSGNLYWDQDHFTYIAGVLKHPQTLLSLIVLTEDQKENLMLLAEAYYLLHLKK